MELFHDEGLLSVISAEKIKGREEEIKGFYPDADKVFVIIKED